MSLTYSSLGDVIGRLPARPINGTSKPSADQVSAWLEEAEAQVTGALRSYGITVPVTDAAGVKIIRTKVVDYAEGLTRQTYATAGNGADDDGLKCLERFDAFLKKIEESPAIVAGMLGAGAASESAASRLRSSFGEDDSEPTFTRETEL